MSVLSGKRVVVTRALHQAPDLENLLLQYQAIPIRYPCIAIVPPEDTTQLDTNLLKLESFDWLILTSTNSIHAIKDRLNTLNHQPDWNKIRVAVVGNKSAQVFSDVFQQTPDFAPDKYTAESLAQTLPINEQSQLFIPQSAIADGRLAQILKERGANVESKIAYRTVIGQGGEDVPAMLERGEIDVLTFTSPSTVRNFAQRIASLSAVDVPVVCIGPSTADMAQRDGYQTIIVPKDYTLSGMVDALLHHFEVDLKNIRQ